MFQRCSKDVFKHLVNQGDPRLSAGLQNVTAVWGRVEQYIYYMNVCWKTLEQITEEPTEISNSLEEMTGHRQHILTKTRGWLTDLISFATMAMSLVVRGLENISLF